MSYDLKLEIEDSAALDEIKHKPGQLAKALQRAVRKTHKWLQRQIITGIAKEILVGQKHVKPRIYSDFDNKTLTGKVWVGLNPISARRAGEPRQTSLGAKAGKYFFPGAFVVRIKNGPANVFKRVGRERLPIKREMIDIDVPGRLVLHRLENQVKQYFNRRLNEEINYALNVETAK
ncbi:MAG: phage tail protein [Flavobacteriales bacterium]